MNKKTFFGGVTTGVVAAIISFAIMNTAAVAIEAKTKSDFSVTDKMNYIANLLDKHYVDKIDESKFLDGAFGGMVASVGDPYTSYLTEENVRSFTENTNGSFQGVGINLLANPEKGTLTVVSPIPGTPAEAAGVLPGDIIIKVDGKDISGMQSDEAIGLIKGVEGTKVNITMLRGNREIDFLLTRADINVQSVAGEMLNDKIAYIELSGFKANTYDQFMKEYNSLMAQGAKGLIIDVRDNPGGMLEIVNKIADKLIPEGNIVYTIDKEGNRIDYKSDAQSVTVPLAVLVNGSSASASEILAGAVQDSGTGVLVGTQTFGKGLVQNLYPIPDGSAVKITIQKYYTPKGVCIQGTGITPDYVVNLPEGMQKALILDKKDDTQLQKAIEVVSGKK